MAALLVDLEVAKTHSRPHVSDDNPYSEAQFKTLKYRPDFPERFGSIEDARAHCPRFFQWYNGTHCHSGIGFMTPESMHDGRAQTLFQQRAETLNVAFLANPQALQGQSPSTAQAASRRLDQSTQTADHHHHSRSFDSNFMQPGVSMSLTRSAIALVTVSRRANIR